MHRTPRPRRPAAALLLLTLVVGELGAIGEARAVPASPSALGDPHVLRVRRRVARAERAVGLGLAALGFATCAAGGALLGISGQSPYEQGSQYERYGALAIVSGAVLIVPGVVLAVVGQNALTDADWRLRLLAGTFVAPSPGGGAVAGLHLRF